MRESERRYRGMVLRPLFVFAALAALAVVLVPTGTASPPSSGIKQASACLSQGALTSATVPGDCITSNLPGGSTVPLTVTIANANTSTQSLGSVNLDAPVSLPMSNPVYISGTGTGTQTFGTNTSNEIQLRNLNLPPTSSVSVTFSVTTPCASSGSLTWTVRGKQSNNFLGTGNDFSFSTSGLNSMIAPGGCHLAFLNQPANTQVSTSTSTYGITDAPGSTGNPIYVALEDSSNNLLTSCPAASCSVQMGTSPSVTLGGHTDRPLSNTSVQIGATTYTGLIATFSDLSIGGISPLPQTFRLTATGDNSLAPQISSDPFEIEESLTDCSSACSVTNLPLGGNGDSLLDFSTAGGYGFVALNPFTFGAIPAGCEGFNPLSNTSKTPVSGFSQSSPVVGGGMTLTYYVSQNAIKARYGKNVGQQFIPICVGAMPVVGDVPVDCRTVTTPGTVNDPNGWIDDLLDSNGGFTGFQGRAVCNPDGFFWGILPSFQDKVPAGGPVATGWSSTTINGITYRFFTMSVPGDWDYKGGG